MRKILNAFVFLFLYICFFLFLATCSNRLDSEYFWLEWGKTRNVEASFSYPGRYIHTFKKRNVRDKILRLIEGAGFTIDLWVYSFEDPEILEALKKANARGVKIGIVADPEKEYADEFKSLGMFRKWERSGLQHSKILIVDRKKLFLGSGNFTWYGLENDLNGYISFDLFDSEIEDFYAFLEEDSGITSLNIPPFQFYISPEKGRLIQNLILREVDRAQRDIRYLIFDHFDSVLTSRLALADRRGVNVKGIYDSPVDEEGKYLAGVFENPGSEIAGDGNEDVIESGSFGKGGLLHHKTMIVDDKTLISGSYNFSISARDNNREILFKTTDPYLINAYIEEWERVHVNAIVYRTTSFGTENESNGVHFGYFENSIPIGVEQTICRTDTTEEESFYLESGKTFLMSILEYTFLPTESCKEVSDFTSSSSGFTGKRTNHPVKTKRFREKGILLTKQGKLFVASTTNDFQADFEHKPVHLFVPTFYSVQSGNLFFPQDLIEFKNPISIFFYQKGNGPITIPWNTSGNTFYVVPHSTEGMIFLEYESSFLAFCFHEYSKKGTEYTELIQEILSYREDAFLPGISSSAEKASIDARKRFGTYCYRY
ncbi:phospholipase D-like domain-containing protein [Leptospira weilii]|uniref:phospholipase D-like domain-containing protein n=1 Tax=Leptospira weilii TaxID=28184 RepID=UPI0003127838|nr:phospholipase D-like domain-containing protein [Leptospira weilii]ULH30339.1 phospholipase D-like domain-containing protein [Leptospira weilii]UPY78063.1 phospholipase D-like domain-containing protein [Leptospira weilii]